MAEFIVTDSLKQLIGSTVGPIITKVEEGAIQRYAKAVGDENPLHNDVEYASQSRWGRLMAPPGFAGWAISPGHDLFHLVEKLIAAGAPRGNLDGGVELEFLAPVGAGDILSAVSSISRLEGRETKMGPTLVTTVETTFTNQRGAKVMVTRNTFLNF